MSEKSTKSTSKRPRNKPIDYGYSKRAKENEHHSHDNVNGSKGMSSNAESMVVAQPVRVAEDIAEIFCEVNIITKKNRDKKGMDDALIATLALRNSCGGIIKLNHAPGSGDAAKIHGWIKNFIDKERMQINNMGENDAHWDIHWKQHDGTDLIFVRKASTILTEKSGLLKRRGKQNEEIRSFGQIKSMLTKDSSRSTSTSCKCHKCDKPSATTQWTYLQNDSFTCNKISESKYIEFKNFPDEDFKELTCFREKVKDNVVAFSNTDGGTLYIGVKDDAEVVGQDIKDEQQIESKIKQYINETEWIPYSTQSSVCADNHYQIRFIPVGKEAMRKVIAIDICKFDGTVFQNKPKCPTIDENGQIDYMPFEQWLLHFQNPAIESQERFTIRKCGLTVYKEVKGTMNDILQNLDALVQMKIHPKHAKEWINNDTLDKLLDVVKGYMTMGGHAFVQRCWNVLLCKPNLKPPSSTICDVLLCSQTSPLVLVTLVDSHGDNDQEVRAYNNALAKILKRVLAEEAGCVEEFIVKPLLICKEDLFDESFRANLFSLPSCYPDDYYSMTGDKYSKIMESLALVLTKITSSVSIEAGQKHFLVLTKEQYDILDDFYGCISKLQLTGLPGTGKTLLALERIKRLRIGSCVEWYRILYVCSNKCLEASIRNHPKMPHDDKPLCKVMNYHQLIQCLKFPNRCGLVELKHILADEVHNYKENPGALPLSTPWWRRITRIKDCTYWFFLDKSQKITTESTVIIPSDVVSRHWTTVIRTTGSIFNFYKRYIATDTSNVKLGHNIQGSFPEILIPKIQSHQEKEKMLQNILLSTLYKLIVNKGFSRNNITVLFTDTKDMERYRKVFLNRAKNCPIRNGEQRNEDGVIFDTIRRYSGDEKSIVIGFCPRFYHSSRFQDSMALMSSLCSRPQLELILVFDSNETALSFQVKNSEWKWYSPPTNQIYDFSS